MSEPSRLCDDAGTDAFARTLLKAASIDREPDDGAARALVALGLVGAAAALDVGRSATGAAGKASSAATASVGAKLGVLALLAAGGIAAAIASSSPPKTSLIGPSAAGGAPATAVPSIAASDVLPASPQEAAIPVDELPPAAALSTASAPAHAPRSGRRPVDARPSVVASRGGVGDEIALIDRARAAIADGDTANAAKELDTYDERFGDGSLVLEAMLARIELHLARSEDARARELCERFLRDHPNTAYDRRVRALLRRAERSNAQ